MADGEEIGRGGGGAEGGEAESEEGDDQDKLGDEGQQSTGELNILLHRPRAPRPRAQHNTPPKWRDLVDGCIKRHGLEMLCEAGLRSEEWRGAPHVFDRIELAGVPVDFDKARRQARDKVAEVLGFMTDIGWILPVGEGNDNVDDAPVQLGDDAPVLPFPDPELRDSGTHETPLIGNMRRSSWRGDGDPVRMTRVSLRRIGSSEPAFTASPSPTGRM
jgi:hypothetical protein